MTRLDKKPISSFENDQNDTSTRAKPEILLAEDHLVRLAKMVADGELPFPRDLPVEHRQRLLVEVQQRRRRMLVNYIARTIALDIDRSRGP